MAVVGELVVAVLGNTAGLSSALAKSEAELKGFGAAATSHGNVASNALKGVGIAGAAVAVGVAAYLTEATHSAIGFQDAMAQVGIRAHLTSEALDTVGSAIERASLGTTSSSLQMVQALLPVSAELERISGHALSAGDAVNLLRAAESLHVTTNTSLIDSTKAIADLLLIYRLRAADSAGVANLLFAASSQLGLGVDSVATALQRLQPRIAGSGVTLEQMLVLFRAMEPTIGVGTAGLRRWGAVLQDFLTPSAAAQKVLGELHVGMQSVISSTVTAGASAGQLTIAQERLHVAQLRLSELQGTSGVAASTMVAAQNRVADATRRLSELQAQGGEVINKYGYALVDAQGKFIGFGPAIDRLQAALANLTPAQRAADLAALFGKNWQSADALIRQGSAGLEANQKALQGQGTAAAGAAARNLDLHQQFLIARATIVTLTDSIGGALLPALTSVANMVLPVIRSIGQWVTLNPGLASQILLVAGALGAMAYVLTNVGAGMALLLGPMGLLVAGVGLLGLAWANNWGGMRDIVSGVVGQVGPIIASLGSVISSIVGVLTSATPSVAEFREGMVSNLSPVASIVQQVRDVVVTAFEDVVDVMSTVITALTTATPTLAVLREGVIANVSPIIPIIQSLRDTAVNVFNALRVAIVATFGWVVDNGRLVQTILGGIAGVMVAMAAVNIVTGIIGFGTALAGVIPAAIALAIALGPITLIALGIGAVVGALAVAWINDWGRVRAFTAVVVGAISVIWHGLAITAKAVAEGIATTWNFLAAVFGAVARGIGNQIGLAANFIRGLLGVVGTVAKAIGDFFGWLFGNTNQAGAALKGLTPQGYPVVPPGGKYEGGINPPPSTGRPPPSGGLYGAVTAASLLASGAVSGPYQHGGVIPGIGPMLAMVHGGETVIPAGGQTIVLNHTSQLVVDGDVLAELVERRMFRNATNFSSGFGAPNPVTGA